jgi:O-antigen/teichoic acid export membrane protein
MSAEVSLAATVGGRAAQTFATRVGATILGLAAGILIARVFGPAGKGAYNAVQSLIAVPVALTFGASAAITFSLVRERHTLRYLFPVIAMVFGGMAALLTGGAGLYGAIHGWNDVAIAVAAVLPAAIVISAQDSYFISFSRIARLNVQTISLQICMLLGCIACVLAHAPIAIVLAAYVAANYLCAAFVLADMIRMARGWDYHNVIERTRRFLHVAAPSGLSSALGVLNYRVDSYILLGLLGISAFGIYTIAVNAGEMLFLVTRPIATVVSREIGGSEAGRSAELAACTIRISVALAAICGAVLVAVAPALIHLLYGARFASGATPLRLLVPGIVAFTSSTAFAAYFIIYLGRPLVMSLINLAMVAVQAGACVALVPHYGMSGAALACTLTYVVGAVGNTWYFCRCSGISPGAVWLLQRRDVVRIRHAAAGMLPKVTAAAARRP